MFAAVVIG